MDYIKFTVETTTEAEDMLSAVLQDAGIEGIEIADSTPWSKEELDEIFVDEVPYDTSIPEGVAFVSFYLSGDDDIVLILENVRNSLLELKSLSDIPCGPLTITEEKVAEEDYLNSWKDFFHAFDIDFDDGRKMSIVPSWEEEKAQGEADLMLHIDPGTAFGTGAHETTKLCIMALERYVKDGMSILDLGTGSGILAMAGFLFGAGKVKAVDVDVNARPAVEDNFTKNGLDDRDFELSIGDVLSDKTLRDTLSLDYDIVVANILPVVLIPLTPMIRDMAGSKYTLIYSGILTEKAPEVIRVLKDNGYEILEETHLGEWCAIISRPV